MNSQDKLTNYTQHYYARVTIETETPMKVGTGETSMLTDAIIATDVNGLPYVPGTAIAGILRHTLSDTLAKQIFGFQEPLKERVERIQGLKKDEPEIADLSKGSEIIFSEARMVGEEGKVLDGLQAIDWQSEFYSHFRNLPIRQHVRINERGTAQKGGKFDEQVVFKGTRFCFEIELLCRENETIQIKRDREIVLYPKEDIFKNLLAELQSGVLCIGGGTRHGFGKFGVVDVKSCILNLKNKEEREAYLNKTSDLNDIFWDKIPSEVKGSSESENWITYGLELQPEDFFLFGAGFGDETADVVPVTELYIVWKDNKPVFQGNKGRTNLLLPASSVKGALAHRVAFYWNQAEERFAGSREKKGQVGKDNPAVTTLFGSEGEWNNGRIEGQKRGNVIFSDLIFSDEKFIEKIFNHVAIDRFTGGAIEGALFSEKVIFGNQVKIPTLSILVHSSVDEKILNVLELALKDLASGMLPLGKAVNQGYGVFVGKVKKEEKVIFDYEKGGRVCVVK